MDDQSLHFVIAIAIYSGDKTVKLHYVIRNVGLGVSLLFGLVATELAAQVPAPTAIARAAATSSAINTMLDGLQKLINDALQYSDAIMANRLSDAHARLRALLPSIDSVAAGLGTKGNEVVDNAANEMLGILGTVRQDAATIGSYSTGYVNTWLSDVSRLTDILLDVPPTLLAVSPIVFRADNPPSRLRLSGYLPGKPDRDVAVSINGVAVPVERAAAHTLTVKLDRAFVKPGSAMELTVRAREYYGLLNLLWRTHQFTERVRVSSSTCFTCIMRTLRENPNFRQEVSSATPFVIEASTQGGKNIPSQTKTILVADLFRATMGPAAAEFDANTAELVSLGADFKAFGGCGGRGPSTSKPTTEGVGGSAIVSVTVTAPKLSREVVRIGRTKLGLPRYRVCDAGGTHGVLTWRPTFRAAKKSSPSIIEARRDTLRFGVDGTAVPHVFGTAQDWSYHVTCSYKDGSEQWSTPTAVVNKRNTSTIVSGLRVRVADDRVLIEPIDRLALSN